MTQEEWNKLTVEKITNIEKFVEGQLKINNNFLNDFKVVDNNVTVLKEFIDRVSEGSKGLIEQNNQLRNIVESLSNEITILKGQVNELTSKH